MLQLRRSAKLGTKVRQNAARWVFLCSGLVVLPIARSHAAGFAFDLEGARAAGDAGAGSAAAADASTIFYNPAGMAFLSHNEFIAGGQMLLLHDRFQNEGSTLLGGAIATPGSNGADAIPPTFVPWAYTTYRLRPDLAVGLGVFAPFGLRTDYGPNFVGRYQNVVTALTAIDINPSLAYRPRKWLAIGGGLDVEYLDVRLTHAIDFGSACSVAIGPAVCAGTLGLRPGLSDGSADLNGQDTSLGFNLGVLVEPVEGTRLGVAYRSGINHHLTGAQESFSAPPGARAFLAAAGMPLALTGSKASTDVTLPGRLSFGLKQMVGDRVSLLLDATLTLWSAFQRTTITAASPVTGANLTIEQNYHNAWRFAAAAEYKISPQWILRGGVAYDKTPIPLSALQAAVPDRDRVLLSIGASFAPSHWVSLDIGYSHITFIGAVPIDRSTSNGDRLLGNFDLGGNVIATQLRVQY